MNRTVTIHTDGSCHNKTGYGGWGVHMMIANTEIEMSGGAIETTSNRMEMMAVLQALNCLNTSEAIVLYTDSQYVQKGATQYMFSWQQDNWSGAIEREIKNLDLWRMMYKLVDKLDVTILWIKGHAGHKFNERADELAGNAYRKIRNKHEGV